MGPDPPEQDGHGRRTCYSDCGSEKTGEVPLTRASVSIPQVTEPYIPTCCTLLPCSGAAVPGTRETSDKTNGQHLYDILKLLKECDKVAYAVVYLEWFRGSSCRRTAWDSLWTVSQSFRPHQRICFWGIRGERPLANPAAFWVTPNPSWECPGASWQVSKTF